MRTLSLLAPHVCRSIAIFEQLDLRTVKSDALEATLERLASGVFLFDRLGRTVHANQAAVRIAGRQDVLRKVGDRVVPTDAVAATTLQRALDGITMGEAAVFPNQLALSSSGNGPGMIGSLLRLDQGIRRSIVLPFAAVAALFAQDPSVAPPFRGEGFAKLYNLAGAELRVLLAMAPGLTIQQTAEMLGNSEATVKTYLQRIFSKTGTSRQTELLANLFGSSAPAGSQKRE